MDCMYLWPKFLNGWGVPAAVGSIGGSCLFFRHGFFADPPLAMSGYYKGAFSIDTMLTQNI